MSFNSIPAEFTPETGIYVCEVPLSIPPSANPEFDANATELMSNLTEFVLSTQLLDAGWRKFQPSKAQIASTEMLGGVSVIRLAVPKPRDAVIAYGYDPQLSERRTLWNVWHRGNDQGMSAQVDRYLGGPLRRLNCGMPLNDDLIQTVLEDAAMQNENRLGIQPQASYDKSAGSGPLADSAAGFTTRAAKNIMYALGVLDDLQLRAEFVPPKLEADAVL